MGCHRSRQKCVKSLREAKEYEGSCLVYSAVAEGEAGEANSRQTGVVNSECHEVHETC